MDETNSEIDGSKESVEEAEIGLVTLTTPPSEGSGVASEDSGLAQQYASNDGTEPDLHESDIDHDNVDEVFSSLTLRQ